MTFLERFKTDELPDATWGICRTHSPTSVIRLVGDDGQPTPNGICQMCYEEAHDTEHFFACPTHGINPKAKGSQGCPVTGCLGKGDGPTPEEVERLTLEISRVWPGGPARGQDVLAQAPAGPESVGAGEAGAGPRDAAREVPSSDPDRGGESAAAPDRQTATPTPRFDHEPTRSAAPPPTEDVPRGRRILTASGDPWRDPFLVDEP